MLIKIKDRLIQTDLIYSAMLDGEYHVIIQIFNEKHPVYVGISPDTLATDDGHKDGYWSLKTLSEREYYIKLAKQNQAAILEFIIAHTNPSCCAPGFPIQRTLKI